MIWVPLQMKCRNRFHVSIAAMQLAVVTLAGTCSAEDVDLRVTEMPRCADAATHAFLELSGHQVPFDVVDGWFETQAVSVGKIRRVLQDYGVAVDVIRVGEISHGAVPSPAILFLKHPSSTELVGHFVVLEATTPEDVLIRDDTLPKTLSATRIPWANLRQVWHGEAIVLQEPGFRREAWGIAVLTVLLACVAIMIGRLRTSNKSVVGASRALVLLATVLLPGCGREPSPQIEGGGLEQPGGNMPLTSDTTVVDLGFIRTQNAKTQHSFVVSSVAREPVKIKRISASCCGNMENRYAALFGRIIQPQETFKVVMTVNTNTVGPVENRMSIFAGDEGLPLILTLRAVVGKPLIVTPLNITAFPGKPIEGTLLINYVKSTTEEPLKWDDAGDSEDPFQLKIETNEILPYASFPDQVHPVNLQRIKLSVHGRPMNLGHHRVSIPLQFSGVSEPIISIVNVEVVHQYGPLISQLFLGETTEGSGIVKKVYFRTPLADSGVVVKTRGDAIRATDWGENFRVLRVECVAPSAAGRFNAMIILEFPAASNIAEIEIPVSGIVQSND